jgi:hypothetical protein
LNSITVGSGQQFFAYLGRAAQNARECCPWLVLYPRRRFGPVSSKESELVGMLLWGAHTSYQLIPSPYFTTLVP